MSDKRYFEDVEVGATHEFGAKTVTAEEIVAFAKEAGCVVIPGSDQFADLVAVERLLGLGQDAQQGQ